MSSIIVGVAAVGAGLVAWRLRWHVGVDAMAIADPVVREWMSAEMRRVSDSAYVMSVSTIHVTPDQHRIAIDSIDVTTDSLANLRRPIPLPALSLRFRRCAVAGIDLSSLASGHGFHAATLGCDSMQVVIHVPHGARADTGRTAGPFLTLQQNLTLPRGLPVLQLDTVAFPRMRVTLQIDGGHPATINLNQLGMRLDGVRYDPKEPIARRRPLLSRNVTLTLDGLDERSAQSSRVAVEHLTADLSDGTCRVDGLVFEPLDRRLADSLGFTALNARHLDFQGIDWRAFLMDGNVVVGRLAIDSATVRVTAAAAPAPHSAPRSIAATLRAVGRNVRLDSAAIDALAIVGTGPARADSAVTTMRTVSVAGVAFGPDDAAWAGPRPIGAARVMARTVLSRSGHDRIAAGRVDLDIGARTLRADSVFLGPEGDDADFARRAWFRRDRREFTAAHVVAHAIDVPALLVRGAYEAGRIDLTGFGFDVLTDNTIPESGTHPVHRMPQDRLRTLPFTVDADTVTIAGRATYRERNPGAPEPGVLAFDALRFTMLHFSNDSARVAGAPPLRASGDARLMGSGALHVELELPLASRTFAMHWRGSLGPMPAARLNGFTAMAHGMQFTGGAVDGIAFDVTVINGEAKGVLAPRWRDLHVALPGVARDHQGLLGGLQRGVAAFAANAFLLRGTNSDSAGAPPVDGAVLHDWSPAETLPEFLWNSIRDALFSVLKH